MSDSQSAIQLDRSAPQTDHDRSLRQWWSAIVALLVLAIFLEAVFAGAMLSGIAWAVTAHKLNAAVLIAATIVAGLLAIVTLRRVANGLRLGLNLSSLAALLFLQAAIGAQTAKGANLLWIHIPLGVALFGLAAQALRSARRLNGQ